MATFLHLLVNSSMEYDGMGRSRPPCLTKRLQPFTP
jgi:hypothetical protein